jgi:uncharacterized membrane protein
MNGTYLHLLLNHMPILASFFGVCLLVYGLWAKQYILQKTAFVFFIVAALVTVPVMLTGEEAEETVENVAGVSENIVEEHEEAAKPAYIAMLATGVFSLLALLLPVFGRTNPKAVTIIVLLLGIASFVLLGRAGLEGGKIIHKEIHGGQQPAGQSVPETEADED